jgi:hypothetical protein
VTACAAAGHAQPARGHEDVKLGHRLGDRQAAADGVGFIEPAFPAGSTRSGGRRQRPCPQPGFFGTEMTDT